MKRLGRVVLFAGVLGFPACSHLSQIDRRAQGDGSYRVECKAPLTRCLTAMEEVCGTGYEVLRAHEDRRYSGPREINEPAVTSEVVARCRTGASSLQALDGSSNPTAASAAGGPSAVTGTPASAKGCFPGATQACVGPGACRGGQQCLADGTAFGPCDCGASTAAPPLPAPEGGTAP